MRFTTAQLALLLGSIAALTGLVTVWSGPRAAEAVGRPAGPRSGWAWIELTEGGYHAPGLPPAPEPIARLAAEDVAEQTRHLLLNVNQADLDELVRLPGIGPATARAILEHREAHGPFGTLDDLVRVPRIGPKTVERIRPMARAGDASPPAGGSTEPYLDEPTPAPVVPASRRINPNTASAEELIRLPRIGPSMAERILQHREEHGGFKTLEDLRRVRGIGAKTLERLRPYLTLEEPS